MLWSNGLLLRAFARIWNIMDFEKYIYFLSMNSEFVTWNECHNWIGPFHGPLWLNHTWNFSAVMLRLVLWEMSLPSMKSFCSIWLNFARSFTVTWCTFCFGTGLHRLFIGLCHLKLWFSNLMCDTWFESLKVPLNNLHW